MIRDACNKTCKWRMHTCTSAEARHVQSSTSGTFTEFYITWLKADAPLLSLVRGQRRC